MSNIEDYGADRYTYVSGDAARYQTGRLRTIRPHAAETNEAFETRLDLMARQLVGRAGIASVTMELERVNGALVLATVSVVETPRPAPIQPDDRPAGGRFAGGRGVRSRS